LIVPTGFAERRRPVSRYGDGFPHLPTGGECVNGAAILSVGGIELAGRSVGDGQSMSGIGRVTNVVGQEVIGLAGQEESMFWIAEMRNRFCLFG
jgi:hypothetical protein